MNTQTHGSLKNIIIDRRFVIGLAILLAVLLAFGYVWMQTDQVIASPGLRVMDGLWKVFFFWK